MSSEPPPLPKYKLAKRSIESEKTPAPSSTANASSPEIEPKRPLQLRPPTQPGIKKDSMLSTADMLEDAYGAEKRTRKRKNTIEKIKACGLTLCVIVLFFVGTLAHAHIYMKLPRLEPLNWYLAFLLGSSFAAWLCLKSIHFIEKRERSLAITGLLLTCTVTYWNSYVLDYAIRGESVSPSNALWVPKDVNDLAIITELNALRGVSKTASAYTELPSQAYYNAFNALDRKHWRPLFHQFLSPDELEQVNHVNVNDYIRVVVERMRAHRATVWTQYKEQQQQASIGWQLQQARLKPYTWVLRHL
ncbi:hypothetical protein SH580_04690 [Coraliomargarita algicola]|uniref:Uncharacterized protein n=1 Tax=Coraliomargarita algicola TaxID=3092156 RepID=A0ABZ0RPD7_9BACT|nr:hypothetical protein [Coraliomargarita sp. J2-16]WPJ97003.1 hypothetical protein SH580_04690 [Coraliomargarita sp. J2-16]